MTGIEAVALYRGAPADAPTRAGLTAAEAERRLADVGPNRAIEQHQESFLEELLESLREPLVLLLLGVGVLYLIFGELSDALVVFGVIVLVAFIEAGIEFRAGRAIAALAAMAEPQALVWREGSLAARPVETIVPGDLIELWPGNRIPADAQVVEGEDLRIDESIVTGESEPVTRVVGDELTAGSLLVAGRGRAIVTRTGAQSTLGRIAALVAETKQPRTPLQQSMDELARVLLWVALAVSVIIPTVSLLAGQPPVEMLLTGLSLAFATIPEELPILIVVVLALGSLRLARRGAIVRRLMAAETLGAVTVICTDKTGTLTMNRMQLAETIPASRLASEREMPPAAALLYAAALATDQVQGGLLLDPVDAAVQGAARQASIALHDHQSFPFDRARRLASGYVRSAAGLEVGVKGAPEEVLARATTWRDGNRIESLTDDERHALAATTAALGRGGRVLAVGSRTLPTAPTGRDELEHDLVFEGVLVFRDPVRREVPSALSALRGAGVGVSIITGDQASTAAAVAEEAGIANVHALSGAELAGVDDKALARTTANGAVVARAQPADKLRIVQALGAAGEVVMVTGDGVNDAPALRAAAVGVAMGRVGSDVARQAADVVLTNDSFATLVEAVREGRRLFDNLRKAVAFYLAVKVALVLASALAAAMGQPLPFSPVQIIVLELFMDLGAALAFVAQRADRDVLTRPARDPKARLLDRGLIVTILAGGITLAITVFGTYQFARARFELAESRTFALVAWFVGHVALGLVTAERRSGLRDLAQNPALLIWAAAAIFFAAALVLVQPLRIALGTTLALLLIVCWAEGHQPVLPNADAQTTAAACGSRLAGELQ
jgi:P-type Ca2+ transporter type 2C